MENHHWLWRSIPGQSPAWHSGPCAAADLAQRIASLHRSCGTTSPRIGEPGHLVTRREISEEHSAECVNNSGKRKQHRTIVESEAVAAAKDDPAPKRTNEGPQNERRKGAKDHSAGWMHRAPVRTRQAWPERLKISEMPAAIARRSDHVRRSVGSAHPAGYDLRPTRLSKNSAFLGVDVRFGS
jgi:hypothetical protein